MVRALVRESHGPNGPHSSRERVEFIKHHVLICESLVERMGDPGHAKLTRAYANNEKDKTHLECIVP